MLTIFCDNILLCCLSQEQDRFYLRKHCFSFSILLGPKTQGVTEVAQHSSLHLFGTLHALLTIETDLFWPDPCCTAPLETCFKTSSWIHQIPIRAQPWSVSCKMIHCAILQTVYSIWLLTMYAIYAVQPSGSDISSRNGTVFCSVVTLVVTVISNMQAPIYDYTIVSQLWC